MLAEASTSLQANTASNATPCSHSRVMPARAALASNGTETSSCASGFK